MGPDQQGPSRLMHLVYIVQLDAQYQLSHMLRSHQATQCTEVTSSDVLTVNLVAVWQSQVSVAVVYLTSLSFRIQSFKIAKASPCKRQPIPVAVPVPSA